jgi:hypothetical protein
MPREGPARFNISMSQHSKRWKNGWEKLRELSKYFQSINIGAAALKELLSL